MYESRGHKTVIDYTLVKKVNVKNVMGIPGNNAALFNINRYSV